MKRCHNVEGGSGRILRLGTRLLAWAVAGALARAAAVVTVTDTEILARGDLDGDGLPDVVVVDRSSGGVRVGYQKPLDVFVWAEARASGVAEVTGLSIGRVLDTARESVVVASPSANRINLLELPTAAASAVPTSLWTPGVGPAMALALDIGGGGNTAHDDLFCVTVANGQPSPNRGSFHRSTGAAINLIGPVTAGGRPMSARRTQLKAGGSVMAGVLERVGAQHHLRIYHVGAGTLVTALSAEQVPGAEWLSAQFGGSALFQYLFWSAGQSNLVRRAVQEPNPGTFQFGPAQTWSFDFGIGQVHPLIGGGSSRLAIIAADGRNLHVFDFDGVAAPVPVQTLAAPAGQLWTGLTGLSDGRFKLFQGSPSDRRSRAFTDFNRVGGQYQAGLTGGLPSPNSTGVSANVFVFDAEPFVAGQARRLLSVNAADWARDPQIAGNPAMLTVQAERRGGSQQGLGNPSLRALGPVPAGGTHVLANQYRPMISLQSFHPAAGLEIAEVRVTPAPGAQEGVIHVGFSARPANAEIHFRTASDAPWTLYAGQGIPLYRETTVEYFGRLPGGDRKTAIAAAHYTFPAPPLEQDSDGDGVPDFAELGLGLDPWNRDTDGDGFDDRTELVAGTDPLNGDPNVVGAVPGAGARLDGNATFDLYATPQPYDGFNQTVIPPRVGTRVQVHTIEGGFLEGAVTAQLAVPGVQQPTAALVPVVVDSRAGVVSVATDYHFPINSAGPDPDIGRELIGLIAVPPAPLVDANGNLPPDDWEFLFGGVVGDLFGDLDGDGYSNLQEYLDGTDPGDANSKGLAVVKLDVPEIEMELLPGEQAKIGWSYPPQYAGFMQFKLLMTDEFGVPFQQGGIEVKNLGGGKFEVILPVSDLPAGFYLLLQLLKGAP
jgi:hypothetical protein